MQFIKIYIKKRYILIEKVDKLQNIYGQKTRERREYKNDWKYTLLYICELSQVYKVLGKVVK